MPYSKQDVENTIQRIAKQHGTDSSYLMRLAQVESRMNPDARNKSGASGLFQFVGGTARHYGLTNPFDPEAATSAAIRLTEANRKHLIKNGIPPTPANLYLAHQQGAAGAVALIAAGQKGISISQLPPDMRKNVMSNIHPRSGVNVNSPVKDFVMSWGDIFTQGEPRRYEYPVKPQEQAQKTPNPVAPQYFSSNQMPQGMGYASADIDYEEQDSDEEYIDTETLRRAQMQQSIIKRLMQMQAENDNELMSLSDDYT